MKAPHIALTAVGWPGLLLLALPALLSSPSLAQQRSLTPDGETKLLAADGEAGDSFGYSVSIAGTNAVVGAFLNDTNGTDRGSAYLFESSGGLWSQHEQLLPDLADPVRLFGFSVSMSGDTALVGAEYDNGDGTTSGAGYVFVKSGNDWTQQARLLAGAGEFTDWFNISVAVSGDTALIGTWRDEENGFLSGAALIFVRSGGVWTQQARLVPSDGETMDAFGFKVALSGDIALIGALGDDDMGFWAGAAYVFVRSGETWTQESKLLAPDGAEYDNFGESVAISGDTALVGSLHDDDNGDRSGSAWVFRRSGETWLDEAKLLASDGDPGDGFGVVSISGNTALIGASFDDTPGGDDAGSAYVFVRSDGVWSEDAKLVAADGEPLDKFGDAVAVSGDNLLVGADLDDDNGADSGSAYVFGPDSLSVSVAGTCPGAATVTIFNAPPNSEVGVVAANNSNGFTKGGALCSGTLFEVGEPFQLPPLWIKTDGSGSGAGDTTLEDDRCWLEALALASCETSGAILAQ